MGVSEVLLCPYRCLEYKMERLEKLRIVVAQLLENRITSSSCLRDGLTGLRVCRLRQFHFPRFRYIALCAVVEWQACYQATGPDSLPRLWRYINLLLTYLLTYSDHF